MKALGKLKINVDLQNPKGIGSLPEPSEMETWCEMAIQTPAYKKAFEDSLSVLIRVVDDAESADLNKTYREKEGPTNVLTFTNDISDIKFGLSELTNKQSEKINRQNSHLGDLVICNSLVNKEAIDQGKSAISHWAHLIVHGTLHLQGFDHIDEAEANQMESLEINILEQLGFKNPYEKV